MSLINEVKLGDIVELIRGTTYKSTLLGLPGPVLLGLASIQRNGGFRSDSLKTYGGTSPTKLLLSPGDLYVSLKDVTQSADLLGAIARVPDIIVCGRLTQDTVKLVFRNDQYPRDLLYWVLRTPQYRNYCRSHATGTTNLGLSREDFLAFNLPKLTQEVLTFTEILNNIEDKIELNRRMNATLEAMARALFKAWFVDFEPVRAKLDGRWQRGQSLPGLPAHLYDLFPDQLVDSELGEIPQGWGVGKVGELFNLTMGQSPPSETYNLVGTGMEFYQGSTDFGTRYPQPRVYCSKPIRIAQPGDTLVSVRAPVGTINSAKRICCLGRGVASVSHKSNAVAYTYYSMLSLKPAFSLFDNEGTVFGSINKTNFENISLVNHPISIIHAFEKIVKDTENRILNNDNEIITLTELRDSLLPKLLTGTFNL